MLIQAPVCMVHLLDTINTICFKKITSCNMAEDNNNFTYECHIQWYNMTNNIHNFKIITTSHMNVTYNDTTWQIIYTTLYEQLAWQNLPLQSMYKSIS